MDIKKVILGKKILIVDDEKDVLETLIELLALCKIDTASSFEEAKKLLETQTYSIVILDIMGVHGHDLLEIAVERDIPALMLTAHALNQENLMTSVKKGAAYFVPKEKMADIAVFVADVLEAKDKKRNPWVKWHERLASTFDIIFTGPDWREKENKFWRDRWDDD